VKKNIIKLELSIFYNKNDGIKDHNDNQIISNIKFGVDNEIKMLNYVTFQIQC